MLKQIRKLFTKEVRGPVKIPFANLSSFLEGREESITRTLEEEMAVHCPQITDVIERIQGILGVLRESEREPSSLPKLEKIARSSLPHFIRALQQHLSHPLPPEPEQFYREAASMLNGCINAMKGAGKYLPMVFPEEMKALRYEISVFGRSLNDMTAVLSRVREERQYITSFRKISESILSLTKEQHERKIRIETLKEQLKDLQKEGDRIRESLETVRKTAEYHRLEEEKKLVTLKEGEMTHRKLQKEQMLGAVLAVYRRAARIARHRKDREVEHLIEAAINQMENSHRDCDQVRDTIRQASPSVMVLIHSSALSLKGQDEQRIFSLPDLLPVEVFRACTDVYAADTEMAEMRRMIQEMPVQNTYLHLIGEEGGVQHAIQRTTANLEEERKAWESLPAQIQALRDDLVQKLAERYNDKYEIDFEGEGEERK
ncbi:MAG: hypothetical protein LUP99_05800 [Methanomicrobiales archaeon]|nr:hypothetical protein [Methanomicrobiales archaeon]